MRIAKSIVVYEGPSMIDGSPTVAVITGLRRASQNPKTGRMAQLWILRSDMSPLEAIDSGADYAICGDCKLRGTGTRDRACYVSLKNAPLAVYRAYRRGRYPVMTAASIAAYLRQQELPIRFGAYGDPVAIPLAILNDLATGIRFTGYTHQWSTAPAYRHLLMASVDCPVEAEQAIAQGWRTFRTRRPDAPLFPNEIMCPASDEMKHRTTCADCTLCDGTRGTDDRRRHIAIIVHGSNKVHYLKLFKAAA